MELIIKNRDLFRICTPWKTQLTQAFGLRLLCALERYFKWNIFSLISESLKKLEIKLR